MSSKNPVVSRTYYYVSVRLMSPISIHGNESYYTDSDVLVNGSGEPFIPGPSIAGAVRGYLEKGSKDSCIYGYTDGEKGRMSSVFISDLYFDRDATIGTRDRVALGSGKTVENKFDLQMVETGITGTMRFEYVKRAEDKYQFENEFARIVYGINRGEIRFGSDKTRGFGRLKVEKIAEKSFEKGAWAEWIKFLPTDETALKWEPFEEWSNNHAEADAKYVSIKVPLKLSGGISIRRYSTRPGEADFEHLTCNDKPVIPGSSWNGAIRADARRLLRELRCKDIDKKLDEWFGFVKVKSGIGKNTNDDSQGALQKEKAKQSMIIFGESVLEGSKPVPMTRNKINRFTGGTVAGALYSEIAYFGGTTTLEILIKEEGDYKPLIGLVSLILEDISAGYVAVGGQTSVGRGIFEPNGEVIYQGGKEPVQLDACLAELVNVINGGKRDENS